MEVAIFVHDRFKIKPDLQICAIEPFCNTNITIIAFYRPSEPGVFFDVLNVLIDILSIEEKYIRCD